MITWGKLGNKSEKIAKEMSIGGASVKCQFYLILVTITKDNRNMKIYTMTTTIQ